VTLEGYRIEREMVRRTDMLAIGDLLTLEEVAQAMHDNRVFLVRRIRKKGRKKRRRSDVAAQPSRTEVRYSQNKSRWRCFWPGRCCGKERQEFKARCMDSNIRADRRFRVFTCCPVCWDVKPKPNACSHK